MKKNLWVRLLTLMMVFTLISTVAVGGTFAKYVTSASASDSARVAKWGVTIEMSSGMFDTKYDKDDSGAYAAVLTVESSTDENVVAPGTSGSLAAEVVSGTPEIAAKMKHSVQNVDFSGWEDENGDFYCPIVISISNPNMVSGTYRLCGLDYDSADAFEAAIKKCIEDGCPIEWTQMDAFFNRDGLKDLFGPDAPDGMTVYLFSAGEAFVEPGEDLSAQNLGMSISWEWPFEGQTGSVRDQSDADDTYLGDQAALDEAATITIAYTASVVQKD